MEYAIGETVTLPDGRKAKVVEGKYCRECAINALGINTCIEWTDGEKIGVCSSAYRSDHKDIIYREVKDADTNPIKERAEELYPYPEGWEWNKNKKWAIDPYGAQREAYIQGATEQKAIDDELLKRTHKGVIDKAIKEDRKRTEELLQYLEELEAHYRDLRQYDDGRPIHRVIEYIKGLERQ